MIANITHETLLFWISFILFLMCKISDQHSFEEVLMLIYVCITVSKALWKSTKPANSFPFFNQYLSKILFIINIWSHALVFIVNPTWQSSRRYMAEILPIWHKLFNHQSLILSWPWKPVVFLWKWRLSERREWCQFFLWKKMPI